MTELTPVVVFARAPEPGKVKTRLASAVGAEGAALLAAAFLRDTWSSLSSVPWVRPIVATTGALDPAFADLEAWDQGGGDLGARIERMLRRALAGAPAAFAVGADTPGLPSHLLDEAREALASADAVLGPCEDGGFYLLGLRSCPPDLLAGLPWSQQDTLDRVRERLESRGMSVALLSAYFDVDRPEDLDRLEGLVHGGAIEAPATAEALRVLGRSPTASPRISVIIPTLDEAERIGRRLSVLADMPSVAEVIVVDGGSADDTTRIAGSFPGVQVLDARKGRARQMNRGAAAAAGDVLMFLHADVALPSDAGRWVGLALSDSRVVAGAFRTWTVPEVGTSRLGPLLHLADLRSRDPDHGGHRARAAPAAGGADPHGASLGAGVGTAFRGAPVLLRLCHEPPAAAASAGHPTRAPLAALRKGPMIRVVIATAMFRARGCRVVRAFGCTRRDPELREE